ncbi:MAG: transposase [Gemmatimonadota bacterium]|nr:MAG: transposase [Gemmatimonadota bacterium]
MELMIKEHKNHLRSDRTLCCRFEANRFRLLLYSMAYMLMHTLRQVHLKKTQFAKASLTRSM